MDNKPQTTNEWANPTPAGLVALAVSCACFFALLTGSVDKSAIPLIGCWLLGGFVVQLVVALLDLKGKNTTGGNTFLFFSAFFMLTGGLEMLVKHLSKGGVDTRIDGYAWSVLALSLLLWTPAFCKKFSLLSIVVLLLDVALPLIALVDLHVLTAPIFATIAAWALLLAGITAIYLAGATVVNAAYGKVIYPLPGSKNK